jgi:hypothetical protein
VRPSRRVGEGVDSRAGSERLSLVQRADAAWCDDVLGEHGAVVHLRTGDFSDWVIAFARRSPVKVIIVPPREGRRGNRVTKVTRTHDAGIPLARPCFDQVDLAQRVECATKCLAGDHQGTAERG